MDEVTKIIGQLTLELAVSKKWELRRRMMETSNTELKKAMREEIGRYTELIEKLLEHTTGGKENIREVEKGVEGEAE